MNEIFPVVAGMLLGFAALRIDSVGLRVFVLAVTSVLLGVVATIISGEALISWAFVLIDIPLVLASAVAVIIATYAWHRRGATQLHS